VTGVDVYGVVGVLPPLGQDDPGLEFLVVQPQVFRQDHGVPHLLDHDHVGPEAEDDHGPVLLAHPAELEPGEHEAVLDLLRAQGQPLRRVVVNPDQIVVAFRSSRRRRLGRPDGELVFYHEIQVQHVPVQGADALVGKDAGEDGSALEALEATAQIGEKQAHPRSVMTFLHDVQRVDGRHG